MSILKWFQGGGAAVEKITDAVIKSGDMLVFTDEEKAIGRAESRAMYMKFLELSRNENSIKSITRRIIAFAVIGEWLLLLNIAVGLVLAGKPDLAEPVFVVLAEIFWLVFAIGSFYFGAWTLDKWQQKKG
jgi:hypothetical protein